MKICFAPIVCTLVAFGGLVISSESVVLPAYAASSFECPKTHATTTNMALKETPADLATVSDALKGPERENAIRVIASNLKKKYPGADKADILNYMLTAYCPLVAANESLGPDEKRARMEQFSSRVFMILGE